MPDLSVLFRRHSAEIARGLRRRGLSRDAAADVTQETFLRVLSLHADREDGGFVAENPAGYLRRIAKNLSIDISRRERNSPFSAQSIDAVHDIGDQCPSPEKVLLDRQKLAVVLDALDALPPRTRRAFELHRLREMTIAEIGRELGLSTSRTGALIKEAYSAIRAHLQIQD